MRFKNSRQRRAVMASIYRNNMRWVGHTQYEVKKGRGPNAPLLKSFYSEKDAKKFRDMINKKIPYDHKWMEDHY